MPDGPPSYVIDTVREIAGTLVVCCSGGADSTATLLWCCDKFPDKTIIATHYDTGLEPPESQPYLTKIAQIANVELAILDGPVYYADGTHVSTVFDIARRRGRFPRPDRCEWRARLKRERCRQWMANAGLHNPLLVIGNLREENEFRANLEYLKRDNEWASGADIFHPLLDWSKHDGRQLLADKGIPIHPAYQHLRKIGCIGCVNSRVGDMQLYAQHYPDILRKLRDLEDELDHKWNRFYSIRQWLPD